ncbi:hypothetical protein L0Y65_01310 [Candidatus Micrarchaeota archaeon]|nr:hypothetical protein [Candidatus Micrarchaeota archaeon]
MKPILYASLLATTAIGGAALNTHLKRQYHTHDYIAEGVPRPRMADNEREHLRERIRALGLGPVSEGILREVERPRVYLYGAATPSEVRLEIKRDGENLRMTYWGVWGNSHLIPKQDWEPITLTYSITADRLNLESITVRPHYALGVYSRESCARLSQETIPVVITNPAHTPGVPGCQYRISDWGAAQAFTQFSMEDWAGFSVWAGFPQSMAPMQITLTIGEPPAQSRAKSTPYY